MTGAWLARWISERTGNEILGNTETVTGDVEAIVGRKAWTASEVDARSDA